MSALQLRCLLVIEGVRLTVSAGFKVVQQVRTNRVPNWGRRGGAICRQSPAALQVPAKLPVRRV
mgnify:CR=1 FL=1